MNGHFQSGAGPSIKRNISQVVTSQLPAFTQIFVVQMTNIFDSTDIFDTFITEDFRSSMYLELSQLPWIGIPKNILNVFKNKLSNF